MANRFLDEAMDEIDNPAFIRKFSVFLLNVLDRFQEKDKIHQEKSMLRNGANVTDNSLEEFMEHLGEAINEFNHEFQAWLEEPNTKNSKRFNDELADFTGELFLLHWFISEHVNDTAVRTAEHVDDVKLSDEQRFVEESEVLEFMMNNCANCAKRDDCRWKVMAMERLVGCEHIWSDFFLRFTHDSGQVYVLCTDIEMVLI